MKRTTRWALIILLVVSFPLAAWAHSATHSHNCNPHGITIDGFRSAHRVMLETDFFGRWREVHDHLSMNNAGQWVLQHTVAGNRC